MKNLFCTLIIGVILIATQLAAPAQPAALEKDNNQKQKVRIVVVEKREGQANSPAQKPRSENRDRKP